MTEPGKAEALAWLRAPDKKLDHLNNEINAAIHELELATRKEPERGAEVDSEE